jgi:hypothetical protein
MCVVVLQGYSAGFPVLLPVGVSALRAQQLVGHLLGGNYLDAAGSKALSAELLTYNPDLQLLGYAAGSFTWTRHGAVEGRGWQWGRGCLICMICFTAGGLGCGDSKGSPLYKDGKAGHVLTCAEGACCTTLEQVRTCAASNNQLLHPHLQGPVLVSACSQGCRCKLSVPLCAQSPGRTCCHAGVWTVAALPAMQGAGGAGRAAGLVVPLWLLVAAWWAWLGWQGRRHLRGFTGTRRQACKVRLQQSVRWCAGCTVLRHCHSVHCCHLALVAWPLLQ